MSAHRVVFIDHNNIGMRDDKLTQRMYLGSGSGELARTTRHQVFAPPSLGEVAVDVNSFVWLRFRNQRIALIGGIVTTLWQTNHHPCIHAIYPIHAFRILVAHLRKEPILVQILPLRRTSRILIHRVGALCRTQLYRIV